MNFTPQLSEVRAIVAEKKYAVVPIICEILSDICTPIEAMQILKSVSTHCYLLESAQANEKWGRYTFLGYDPEMEITCANGILRAGDVTMQTEDPSAVAADTLPQELKATARTEDGEIKDGWFKSYGGAERAALTTCQSPQKGEM